jgi:hypothetical protein
MINFLELFLSQSQTDNLKTVSYDKEYGGLNMKVSFGMGNPARVSWIAFYSDEMKVSDGFYPVYLYYKAKQTLILAYGISETFEYARTWSQTSIENSKIIEEFFGERVPRYGKSYVFKSYSVAFNNGMPSLHQNGEQVSMVGLTTHLDELINTYRSELSIEAQSLDNPENKGLFYMEKQLEDFLILNWVNTDLGKKYDLLIEDGELISQQYRTDIGPIDILAKDRKDGSYVVIELKRNQTSDDTVGQLMRYMGWVKRHLNDPNVKGVIIAGKYDRKLDYALEFAPGETNVYIYNVSFSLNEFKKQ